MQTEILLPAAGLRAAQPAASETWRVQRVPAASADADAADGSDTATPTRYAVSLSARAVPDPVAPTAGTSAERDSAMAPASTVTNGRSDRQSRMARVRTQAEANGSPSLHAGDPAGDEFTGISGLRCPAGNDHGAADQDRDQDQVLEAGTEDTTLVEPPAPRPRPKPSGPRPGSGLRCSFGAALAALFTAGFIHYYCHQGGVAASPTASGSGSGMPSVPGMGKPIRLKGIAGPFDVELEKAELCEKEKQGVGAAKMDWGEIAKDKDVPKRYHISGRGSFNYNTSDDLAAKFLLASWVFPGHWVTYYSNTFSGGCSMAKNFSPERWRRVSLLVFGHENAECPFPPMRVEVSNFTVENKQSLVKEFIYGRWKVENQIIDVANNNRPVSCGRAVFRVVPKKDRPMPAVVPPFDNSDRMSFELVEPPDAPP